VKIIRLTYTVTCIICVLEVHGVEQDSSPHSQVKNHLTRTLGYYILCVLKVDLPVNRKVIQMNRSAK